MNDTPEKPNRRKAAKALTRQKLSEAAKALFTTQPYEEANIRDIAVKAGMSTGAFFATWDSKAECWTDLMKSPPPVDSSLTRAAPAMLDLLREISDRRTLGPTLDNRVDELIGAAEAPFPPKPMEA